jgi:dihydropyrimidinase
VNLSVPLCSQPVSQRRIEVKPPSSIRSACGPTGSRACRRLRAGIGWLRRAALCDDARMHAPEADLIVRGGRVVTAGHEQEADVAITGGQIVQLGGEMSGRRELDAHGLLVLPGGIDAHVHLVCAALAAGSAAAGWPFWVDDFWSGSRAAIAGGITTIGSMTGQLPGETMTDAIRRDMAGASAEAAVDWFLHPILPGTGADTAAEAVALARGGHTSNKLFLTVPDFDIDTGELAQLVTAAGQAGAITLVHCEEAGLVAEAGQELIAAGRGAVRYFADARTVEAEVQAVGRAVDLSRTADVPVYVVHLSSAQALARCHAARSAGARVYVETRPLYLHLTRERFGEPDGAKYVGAPPLRTLADREALWHGLAAGQIDTVCSDHAPWTLDQKLDPDLDVTTARQGVADLETLMPMLFSEGVLTGRISLTRFVQLTSANAARLFGLHPRKGTIAPGADADLVLWDPHARRVVDGAAMQSRAGYSVYDGWQVTGWPVVVLRRGQVVLADGVITAKPGDGQWLRRQASGAPDVTI